MLSPCPHTANNCADHNKAIMYAKCLDNVYTFLFNAIRENIKGLMFKVTLHYFVSRTLRIHMIYLVYEARNPLYLSEQAVLPKIRLLAACLVHKKILEIPCYT